MHPVAALALLLVAVWAVITLWPLILALLALAAAVWFIGFCIGFVLHLFGWRY